MHEPSLTITIELILKDYIVLPEQLDADDEPKSAASLGYAGLRAVKDLPKLWEVRNQQTYYLKIHLHEYHP